MTDIGVNGIGKVNRRRTLRQGEDFAFGRQDIDFVGEQIDFDVLKEFDGVRAAGLQIKDVFEPLVGMEDGLIRSIFTGFVNPMAGNTSLSHSIHFTRTDLHFDRQTVRADQGRVQALITVAFRNGNIVFKTARLGMV